MIAFLFQVAVIAASAHFVALLIVYMVLALIPSYVTGTIPVWLYHTVSMYISVIGATYVKFEQKILLTELLSYAAIIVATHIVSLFLWARYGSAVMRLITGAVIPFVLE
jgi:hypothetical protein